MWLVSADTCGGGTRDEALKVSAWEASNTGSKHSFVWTDGEVEVGLTGNCIRASTPIFRISFYS